MGTPDLEKLIYEIKNQAFDTAMLVADFFKGPRGMAVGAGAVVFYILFMKTWTLRKTSSFLFTIFLFFAILLRIQAYLVSTLGDEHAQIPTGISWIVFFAISAFVFLYQAAVKE